MHRQFELPDLFLAISLAMIAIEAALAGMSVIKAKYRTRDTVASLSMQVGNIAVNLLMASFIFSGLKLAYRARMFDISSSRSNITCRRRYGRVGRVSSWARGLRGYPWRFWVSRPR